MASTLKIHVKTVDMHLLHLRRKVRANGMVQLAIYCERLNGALAPHGKEVSVARTSPS